MVSFFAVANTSSVSPSSSTSSMNSSPDTTTKETTTTKSKTVMPSGEEVDSMHQESTVKSPTKSKIEAQEEDTHMNRNSGATTEDVEE